MIKKLFVLPLVLTFLLGGLSTQNVNAGVCPLVTPEIPRCGENPYTCDQPSSMVYGEDSWGPGTWICGQCLDGNNSGSWYDNSSNCCGECPSPNTGTVTVSANIAGASWTVTGPSSFTGSGTSQSEPYQPTGTYTITWAAVSGYTTPSSQTYTLFDQGSIGFSGNYIAATPSVNIYFSTLHTIKNHMKGFLTIANNNKVHAN